MYLQYHIPFHLSYYNLYYTFIYLYYNLYRTEHVYKYVNFDCLQFYCIFFLNKQLGRKMLYILQTYKNSRHRRVVTMTAFGACLLVRRHSLFP